MEAAITAAEVRVKGSRQRATSPYCSIKVLSISNLLNASNLLPLFKKIIYYHI